MDREHLTRLVQDPSRVQRDDIADLKAMAERYPWFSGAHLLLAVGEHAAGDVLFDEQLRVAAAHLPSRAVLFDRSERATVEESAVLLRKDRRPIQVVVEPPPVKEAPTPAAPASVAPVSPAPEIPIAVEVPTVEAATDLPPAPAFEPVTSEPSEIEVPATAELEAPPPSATEERVDPLDQVIRESALSAAFALAMEAELPAAPPAPPPSAPVQTAPAPRTVVKRRFTDWLENTNDRTTSPAPPAPATVQPGTSSEKRASAAELPALGIVQELIQQQTTKQPKAEFFDPQRSAKRSLEDHADMVTETLARIYEKQGNFAKARAAYERLAVKHPEKQDYFREKAKGLEGW